MDLNAFVYENVTQNGPHISFTFLVSKNPTLTDYKVRSALLAYCVAHYDLCLGGSITDPNTGLDQGVVVATFIRRM